MLMFTHIILYLFDKKLLNALNKHRRYMPNIELPIFENTECLI